MTLSDGTEEDGDSTMPGYEALSEFPSAWLLLQMLCIALDGLSLGSALRVLWLVQVHASLGYKRDSPCDKAPHALPSTATAN